MTTLKQSYLSVLHVIQQKKKEGWFAHIWLLGGLAYLVVFAAGNVQHDYYQILLVPIISLLVAKGLVGVIREKAFVNRWISIPGAVVIFLFM